MNAKQEAFCREYLVDLNGAQSAIRAGYSPKAANVYASQLLAKPNIRARIDKEMAERSRRVGVNAERVVRELARIGFARLSDVVDTSTAEPLKSASEDDGAALLSVRVKAVLTQDGVITEREARLCDKLKALELLGRHLGMFTDRVQISEAPRIVDDVDGGD